MQKQQRDSKFNLGTHIFITTNLWLKMQPIRMSKIEQSGYKPIFQIQLFLAEYLSYINKQSAFCGVIKCRNMITLCIYSHFSNKLRVNGWLNLQPLQSIFVLYSGYIFSHRRFDHIFLVYYVCLVLQRLTINHINQKPKASPPRQCNTGKM